MSNKPPLPPFEFRELRNRETSTSFVIHVPANIHSKGELLAALAAAGRFPSYFGGNWDALSDCLRDFGWIEQEDIVLTHSDLPLGDESRECRTYLRVLREAVQNWTRSGESSGEKEVGSPKHRLSVLFPPSLRNVVSESLRG